MNMKIVASLLLIGGIACSSPQQERQTDNDVKFIDSPTGANASLPYLVTGEDGHLYFSWVEKQDSNWVEFKYSKLSNNGWSTPELIARGNNWFVNWADYPMIAIDKKGNMIAHYLKKSASSTYAYDVNIVFKSKEGSWSDPIVPHKDDTPTEHGFVTMLPQSEGNFLVAWLDGRNTAGGEHGSSDGHKGSMTLRSAVINIDGSLREEMELDPRVCDCCQTGGAMTASGPVIVFRDRSENEIRDISFVNRQSNTWSSAQSVSNDNWKIEGCPVNGPRMASLGNTSALAWFTAANDEAQVKLAFSGTMNSFGEPLVIDDDAPLGRVDVVMLDQETAVVSWLDNVDKPSIRYRLVEVNGEMEASKVLSSTSESRSSGFPQMEIFDGTIYFAWTDQNQEAGAAIKLAKWR